MDSVTINRKYYQFIWQWLLVFAILPLLPEVDVIGDELPAISIIIDDVGDSKRLGYRAAELDESVALSILPHTPFSQEIAAYGHNRGMEILLHQPMESLENIRLLGPGALLQDMDRQQFARTLEENINAVPFVIGINNHMGSLLTTDYEKMNWLMAELKLRDIFFIDSRTTTRTIAFKTARYWQLPAMSRKIFLDHNDEPEAIAEQYEQLLKIAKKYGHAIAIGHPRENTLKFLEVALPGLSDQGIRLVSPGKIMRMKFPEKQVHYEQTEFPAQTNFYDTCYISDAVNAPNKMMLDQLFHRYKCFVSQ